VKEATVPHSDDYIKGFEDGAQFVRDQFERKLKIDLARLEAKLTARIDGKIAGIEADESVQH
jgi:hypothetical protein